MPRLTLPHPVRALRPLLACLLTCAALGASYDARALSLPEDPDATPAHAPPPRGGDEGAALWQLYMPSLNASAPIFQEFADYALLSATMRADPSRYGDASPLTLRVGVSQRLWKPIGPNTPDQAWTATILSGEAGYYFSPLAWVQARSLLDMAWLASGDGLDPAQEGTIAQGSHRVRGQVGLGDVRRGFGADLELDARLDHAAPLTLRARPADVMPIGHRDASALGRLWLRSAGDDEGGFVMPISYEVRRLTYTDAALAEAAPLNGMTRHTISTGIGMRPYFVHGDGWLEFIGLSWHRARLDLNNLPAPVGKPCCSTDPAPPDALSPPATLLRFNDLEQIDLRVLHSDRLTLYEGDFVLTGYFFIGGSWMWDPVGAQQASMITGAYGMSARFKHGSFGGVFSRRPGVAPDGSRPIAVNRLEWLAELFVPEGHFGGSFSASSAWIEDLHRAVEAQTMQAQHHLHTELFFAPVPEVSVGVFHSAGGFNAGDREWGPPTFPTLYGDWQHQLGLFMRLRAEPLSLLSGARW